MTQTIETVRAAKEYLDGELAKYETWEELSGVFARQVFETEAVWRNTKSKGVGRDTIVKFLGGNWKGWMIQ